MFKLKKWINPDKLIWSIVSKHPEALDLLKENLKKIDWNYLSQNINPAAIEILKKIQKK